MARKTKSAKTPKTARKPRKAGNITETVLTKPEIAARFAHVAGDRTAYERLAEANGIRLNPALDNGRTAMVTRNLIRARALKGERVVWPQ